MLRKRDMILERLIWEDKFELLGRLNKLACEGKTAVLSEDLEQATSHVVK